MFYSFSVVAVFYSHHSNNDNTVVEFDAVVVGDVDKVRASGQSVMNQKYLC